MSPDEEEEEEEEGEEEEEEESIDKALLQMGDCPLKWWSGRQHTHEKLAGIAKKHLSTL